MDLFILVNHFLPAALIVLSFFFSVRCLFAHDMRLEAWRSPVKHWIYIDHHAFKRIIKSLGLMFMAIFLMATYHEILGLIS